MLISINGSLINTSLIYEITDIVFHNECHASFAIRFIEGTEKTIACSLTWLVQKMLDLPNRQDSMGVAYNWLQQNVPQTDWDLLILNYLIEIRDFVASKIDPNPNIPTFNKKINLAKYTKPMVN